MARDSATAKDGGRPTGERALPLPSALQIPGSMFTTESSTYQKVHSQKELALLLLFLI